ncbi:MAG: hypothetical protein JKX69_11890 [Rhodobacteraceae bacterium]|nr:hypothetical protein [Paracoccaceae bacterium]PHR55654.1 MAG: acyl-CoA dehydrogenase [Robiginitomaculum sp.]
MRLAFNEDQTTFSTFLEQMLASDVCGFRPAPEWERLEYGDAIDVQLAENGFFDAAAEETLGPVMAAEMIFKIAQLPVAVECAASALLRPNFASKLPRPIAVIEAEPHHPIRFLPMARSVIWLSQSKVRTAILKDGDVQKADTLFAYPMGVLNMAALTWDDVDTDAAKALDLWRIGVAAELAGALKGGLNSVLEHVKERHQFGRPLGSFQAVQHRLAQGVIEIDSARWLILKAAQSQDPADAALALAHTQNMATRIGYDLHQFMGAMGLTLEHPLHRWTYRARLLRSALGGASSAFGHYADARWGPA